MAQYEPYDPNAAVTLSDDELARLVNQLRSILDIRDREYGFPARTYPRCFIGEEAVAAMLVAGLARDEADAVALGNVLLTAGVIRHVLDEHPFRNAALFYRFTADDDRGRVAQTASGSAVSWSDFLAPLAAARDDRLNLQPRIPARDAALASFAQDDLAGHAIAPLDAHNAALLDAVRPRVWIDPRAKPRYNLVVIGAGTGGLVSAAGAAGLGAQVALVEAHLMGGDCLNLGCVPSKALLRSAKVAASARKAGQYGVHCGPVEVDFAAVMERMRRLRAGIAPHDSAQRFANLGADVFLGRARFTGRNSVEVNGQTLNFAKAIVATGATAAIPPIPGLADVPYLTNATVFNLTTLPPRLAVVGAGPIGMELAQAFRRFGSEVSVFYRDRLLPKEDRDAAWLVEQSMRGDGVHFIQAAEYGHIRRGSAAPIEIEYRAADGRVQLAQFDALLLATGRKPTVAGLGLEAAGVDYDARTGIAVDDRLQTSNPDVYAVGDVASVYQFTHMADFMARLALRNALFFGREKASDLLVPWVTYTDPEVAHVGLYEADLRERNIPFETFTRDLADVDRSRLDGETAGFAKIHVKRGGDKILGATLVGPHAGETIGEIAVAIRAGMGLGTLASVIHPYPTAAEAIRQCGDAFNRGRLTPTVRKLFDRFLAARR